MLDPQGLSSENVLNSLVQIQSDMHMKKSDSKRQAILDAACRLFREQGFEKTSIAEITERVGGSKATLYNYFPSKESLLLEVMHHAKELELQAIVGALDPDAEDLRKELLRFGQEFLTVLYSPEAISIRRLIIAEAARSGTGRLFFDKIAALRAKVAAFLSGCMSAGTLRCDDPNLAADHLGALLEAQVLEPLLLHVREDSPDEEEIALAGERAVATFLRAYAPSGRTACAVAAAATSR